MMMMVMMWMVIVVVMMMVLERRLSSLSMVLEIMDKVAAARPVHKSASCHEIFLPRQIRRLLIKHQATVVIIFAIFTGKLPKKFFAGSVRKEGRGVPLNPH